jgi:chromosome segregation ATPase
MEEETSDHATESERRDTWRLPTVGRILTDSLGDLRAAATFLRRVLPEIAKDLSHIRDHVEVVDRETTGMHASVERIEIEIGALSGRISELGERMQAVEEAVVRLEPHVAEVNLAVRPFRRARARFRSAAEIPADQPAEAD